MKNLLSTLLLLFSFHFSVNACLNYFYGTDKDGNTHNITYFIKSPFYKNFNVQKHHNYLKKAYEKLEEEHSYQDLSDYAVSLMKLGKADVALEILRELNYYHPDDYKIVANLGTAYELNAKLDSALKYIKKGIQLNPNSHGGSEWVHVKILKAKQKINQDTSYLSKNSILNLSEKQKKDKEIYKQINIQLRERFPFSPPPNEIMAHLLMELAECSENTISVEYANALYKMVKNYYEYDSDYLQDKIKETQKLKQKYANKKTEKDSDRSYQDRLTYFSYTQFLRDFPQTEINWNKINTDVAALLTLANLERMPKFAPLVTPNTENEETTTKFAKNDDITDKNHQAIKEKFIYGSFTI